MNMCTLQVCRLELICRKALSEGVSAGSAVPLLEAAHATDDQRLFAQCRRYISENSVAVKESGGIEQLQDHRITKGVLSDVISRVDVLEKQLAVHRAQS